MGAWDDIATRQHGLISAAQLRRLCLSRDAILRRVEWGLLDVVVPGVYRIPGSPDTWRQRVMAAVLWSGDGVASHRTAGALWGLTGCPESAIEICTDKQAKLAKKGFRTHRRQVPERLITKVDGVPVTNVARTLTDLATALPADTFGRAVEDACRKGLTSPAALRAHLVKESRRGRPGVGILRAWLDAGDALEGVSVTAFQQDVRRLLKEVGGFREEVVIRDAEGQELARVDFCHDALPVILEADGRKDHSGRDDWYHDLRRRRRVTSQGYLALHVMPQDIAFAQGRASFLAAVRATMDRCARAGTAERENREGA